MSTCTAGGSRSTSRAQTHELVLDIDDLADLPRGRAIILSSGNPAALIRTEPWHTGPHADAVAASIAAHHPGAARTSADGGGGGGATATTLPDHVPDIPTPAQLREEWTRPDALR